MEPRKDTFLDKSSLLAFFLLGFCWIAWNSYMKKKYPNVPQEKVAQQEIQIEPQKIRAEAKPLKETKEKFYKYSGEKIEVVFSSKGFGVTELKLKEHFDREGRPFVFESSKRALHSTQDPETEKAIPFKIKRKGKKFIGTYRGSDFQMVKTIELDEENFLLKTKMEITHGERGLKTLRTFFKQSLPKDKKQNFFVKMLSAYGQDAFKGFVFFQGKKNLFTESNLEEEQKYSGFTIGALGGKYFGTAFVNKSGLLPTMSVQKEGEEIVAKVDYTLLDKKPITINYVSFFGPKSSEKLKNLAPEAKGWIDFGFFSMLAHPLLFSLKILYKLTYNWGFAIVLLTFFIRLCLLPINIKSYRSMKTMQTIQPEMKRLREEYKKDPKKLNLEIMALMKENKANPLQGCLPLFLQTPVFFALYRVLGESIELYQAPFIFWIQDLSFKDPYYVFPVLAGLTLFVQQKITPMAIPAAQARLLTFMPIVFSVFMLSLPSGLTLYIFVSGLFGLVQQTFFVKFRKQ